MKKIVGILIGVASCLVWHSVFVKSCPTIQHQLRRKRVNPLPKNLPAKNSPPQRNRLRSRRINPSRLPANPKSRQLSKVKNTIKQEKRSRVQRQRLIRPQRPTKLPRVILVLSQLTGQRLLPKKAPPLQRDRLVNQQRRKTRLLKSEPLKRNG